jgi:hypothetical protein
MEQSTKLAIVPTGERHWTKAELLKALNGAFESLPYQGKEEFRSDLISFVMKELNHVPVFVPRNRESPESCDGCE